MPTCARRARSVSRQPQKTLRVLKEPALVCLLLGFGDSSVELELRIWIHDPKNGVRNVKSDVLLLVWDEFHAHGIEIPFPQRDLHLKTPMEIKVATQSADGAARAWPGSE
jgi:small-conductance mechanosensitive channel